jgi:hypothetical protein
LDGLLPAIQGDAEATKALELLRTKLAGTNGAPPPPAAAGVGPSAGAGVRELHEFESIQEVGDEILAALARSVDMDTTADAGTGVAVPVDPPDGLDEREQWRVVQRKRCARAFETHKSVSKVLKTAIKSKGA